MSERATRAERKAEEAEEEARGIKEKSLKELEKEKVSQRMLQS